jgi:N-methylhydantoinase B
MGMSVSPADTRRINPITAEIIRHALLQIPTQIELNITRTAYSPLIYEYKDFAVGIADEQGRLVCQGDGGIPLFVANTIGAAVRDGLMIHGREGIEPGDVFISNHSGTLGQHLNNVAMYTPIYGDAAETALVGFMCVVVHWIDIGGAFIGSSTTHGTNSIYQEGLHLRSVKLRSRGKPVADMYRLIEMNTRLPRELFGDIEAQLAGCLSGRDMFAALLRKYGLETVRGAITLMWDRSEAAARSAIAKIPDGTYDAQSFLDDDGVDIGKPINVHAKVTIAGDTMTVDFTGVSPAVKGPLNSGRDGGAVTAARIAFKYLVAPDEPANEGTFRPLQVVIPDGTFISAPWTAPMGGYSAPLPTVIDTVLHAMVDASPDEATAAHHGVFGHHSFNGIHPQTHELYRCSATMQGGWGASKGHDGPGPYKTMAHGDTLDFPVEVQEALYPVRIESQVLRANSGGHGEFRGGNGVVKISRFLAPATSNVFVDRQGCPPWGVFGGLDGQSPEMLIERSGAAPEPKHKGPVQLKPGDRMHIISGGGGGYGDPVLRDPERVARDVRFGYVAADVALDVYAVVCDAAGRLDAEATAMLRSERL